MDALEELGQMHVEAKEAFRRIDGAEAPDRSRLWARLRPELELHEKIEERFVYDPVAREVGARDATLKAWEHEHEEQAREADAIISRLGDLDPTAPDWLAEFRSLVSMMDGHIAHEERDVWPKIRSEWGEQRLEQAGRPVAAAKAAAKAGASVDDALSRAGDVLRP